MEISPNFHVISYHLIFSESIQQDAQLQQIWPLSCYGPDNHIYPPVNLISGPDLEQSFDEIRLMFYQNPQSCVSDALYFLSLYFSKVKSLQASHIKI